MIRVATAWILTLAMSQGDEPNTYPRLENILSNENRFILSQIVSDLLVM